MINRVVDGIDGVKTGLHICRGNWSTKDEVHLSGDYEPLTAALSELRVNQFVLEYATPRAGEFGIVGQALNDREIGLGVVNPRTDEIESPRAIVDRVKEALSYFQPEKVFLNPDCGFGTFAERNVNTADTAFRKLRSVSAAAAMLRQEFG